MSKHRRVRRAISELEQEQDPRPSPYFLLAVEGVLAIVAGLLANLVRPGFGWTAGMVFFVTAAITIALRRWGGLDGWGQ